MYKLLAILLVLGVFLLGISGCGWGKDIINGDTLRDEAASLLEGSSDAEQQAPAPEIFPELIPEG